MSQTGVYVWAYLQIVIQTLYEAIKGNYDKELFMYVLCLAWILPLFAVGVVLIVLGITIAVKSVKKAATDMRNR